MTLIREQIIAKARNRWTGESEKKKYARQDFDSAPGGPAPEPGRWPRVYRRQRRHQCGWRPSYREAASASANPIIFLPQDEYHSANRPARAKRQGFDNCGWPGLKESCQSTAEWSFAEPGAGHSEPGSQPEGKQTAQHKTKTNRQKITKRWRNNRFSNVYKIQWSMPENVSFN